MSNTSIISAADAAAASAAFDYAAAQLMALYNDPIQVNITLNVVAGTGTLGGSNTPLNGVFTYAQVKAALIADGSSGDDATFNATLPVADPTGSNRYFMARAQAKALGLIPSDATLDGTFTFGAGFQYTYDPNNRTVAGKFDFIAIAFHEITEIMGRIPGLGNQFGTGVNSYLPYDLYRFKGTGVRGLTGGAGEYYSINNGVTNGKDFNNAILNGGDPQDWASGTNDAFNAFTGPGVMNALTPVDIQVMDVIGYNSACTPPTFTACPGNQNANTAPGVCTAVVSYTATANGTPTPTITHAFTGATTGSGSGTGSGSTFNKGTTTVVITASNGCGNNATCSFTVTVSDNQAPVLTCPGNQTLNVVPNTCAANYTIADPISDNCTGATWNYSRNGATVSSALGIPDGTGSGSLSYNKGVTTVILTGTDGTNNATSCFFTVTVIDNQPPAISGCPGNITAFTGPGRTTCDQTASWTPPTATDNCGAVTTSSTHSPGATFPVGTTPVTYTFTDGSSLSSTCSFNVTVVDNTVPDAQCKAATVHLSGGTASITPSDVDNSSTDNCGIVSRAVAPNKFDCSQIGTTVPVVLTLKDAANNTSSCTAQVTIAGTPVACSISVTPCAPNVCTNAPVTTIFLGYGPQCATMTANATGGDGGGYTYSWSPSAKLSCTTCQSPTFTPTAPGCYTYTVTVTNVNSGCSSTCNVTFCVKDIRDPGHSNKVFVCHVPDGNPGNAHTLSISVNAVPSHVCMHGGDQLGKCDDPCVCAPVARMVAAGSGSSTSNLDVFAYPNPFNSVINVQFKGGATDLADIRVYDATGRLLEAKQSQHAGVEIQIGEKLVPGMYIVEVRQGTSSKKIQVVKY
jgi:hypothetical protein